MLPRIFLENILSNAFQGVVKIQGLSLYPILTAQRVYLYDSPRDARENRPVLSLENVLVKYSLIPENGRFVTNLVADKLSFELEERTAGESNYEFFRKFIQAPPSKFDPSIFIPKNITFKTIDARISTLSWHCAVNNLTATISVAELDDIAATVNGNNVVGETGWTKNPATTSNFQQGMVEAVLQVRKHEVKLEPLKAHLPEILDGEAQITLKRAPEETSLEWTVNRTSIAGPLASTFINTVRSVGISLSNVHIEQSSGKFLIDNQRKAAVSNMSVDALLERACLETPEYPLDIGDVHIQGNWAEESGNLQIRLAEQRTLLLTKENASLYRLTAQNWSRNDVIQIVPGTLRQRFSSWFPLWRTVSLKFLWDDQEESRVLSCEIVPAKANKKTESKLDFKLVTTKENADWSTSLNSATIEASVQVADTQKPRKILEVRGVVSDKGQNYDISAELKDASLDDLSLWMPFNLSQNYLFAILSGKASISCSGSDILCSLNLDGHHISFLGKGLPENEAASFTSEFAIPRTYQSMTIKNIALRCGKWLRASAEPFAADFSTGILKTCLSAHIDLEALGTAFSKDGLHGILTLEAPITCANGVLSSVLDGAGKDISMGALYFASDPPLRSKIPFKYDFSKRVLRVAKSTLENGQKIEFTVEPFAFNTSDRSATIPFSLRTDLSIFHDGGYFSKLEDGNLQITGLMHIAASTIQYEAQLNGSAALLGIRDDSAILNGTRIEGTFTQDAGQGKMQCDNLAAMGLNISGLVSSWQYQGGALKSENLEGNLFGGNVFGVFSQEVLTPDRRGSLQLKLQQIDLEKFTEEFKPEDIELTGIANGTLTAAWHQGQMENLRMELLSHENFSVNRSFLEWLLLSQYEQGKWSDKVFKTIRDKALGPASQHAFDSGQLVLEWRDQEYVGEVALKGKGLNLTISPRIDEGVITNALELRQQVQIQDLINSFGNALRNH